MLGHVLTLNIELIHFTNETGFFLYVHARVKIFKKCEKKFHIQGQNIAFTVFFHIQEAARNNDR